MVYLFVGIGAAIGGILIGILIFNFDDKELLNNNLKMFLTVGFCGGFTTFSTFSLETLNLLKDTQFLLGFLNILLNILLCLIGTGLAYLVSKISV